MKGKKENLKRKGVGRVRHVSAREAPYRVRKRERGGERGPKIIKRMDCLDWQKRASNSSSLFRLPP